MRRWTSWRPAALWPGGGRRDEWRPVDLHPSGVWRAAGLPRVALRPPPACMRGVRRPRPRRRVVAAVRSAPPRMTSWWPTFVGLLEASPFHGEGYRKVWVKLRVEGRRTSKERVRRLMREHDLQAPQRAGHAHGPKAHDGTITTEAPDVMWGTDMTATVTVAEGPAFVFVAVDHCTAECIGLHAAKRGDPLRGPGADPAGHPRTLRGHRRRRGPWAAAASRPRVELLGRRFPAGGRVLRHRKFPELRAGARRQRRRGALHSAR